MEDRAPHPLGDSLSAIRSGWLGRDCAAVYPECSIATAPASAVEQALTYFTRWVGGAVCAVIYMYINK